MKKKEKTMKQIIILLSTVILGIAIATMILSFQEPTDDIKEVTQNEMKSVLHLF
jgi:hypothetical protein